jgi:hypothetical protein
VCVCNVYTIMECQRDSAVRSAVTGRDWQHRMGCRWYG